MIDWLTGHLNLDFFQCHLLPTITEQQTLKSQAFHQIVYSTKFCRTHKRNMSVVPPPYHWSHYREWQQIRDLSSTLLSPARMAQIEGRRGNWHGTLIVYISGTMVHWCSCSYKEWIHISSTGMHVTWTCMWIVQQYNDSITPSLMALFALFKKNNLMYKFICLQPSRTVQFTPSIPNVYSFLTFLKKHKNFR